MPKRIQRLVFVHDGDTGKIGEVLRACDGELMFCGEGSGLLHLDEPIDHSSPPPDEWGTRRVRVAIKRVSQLTPLEQDVVGDQVPCILAIDGMHVGVLLGPRSVARCQGTLGDLRGKIRFGAASTGWEL